jgi:hypothetical protein
MTVETDAVRRRRPKTSDIVKASTKAQAWTMRRKALIQELEAAIQDEPAGVDRDGLLVTWALWTQGPEYAAWYGVDRFEENFRGKKT